jgi:hypothetical protein
MVAGEGGGAAEFGGDEFVLSAEESAQKALTENTRTATRERDGQRRDFTAGVLSETWRYYLIGGHKTADREIWPKSYRFIY